MKHLNSPFKINRRNLLLTGSAALISAAAPVRAQVEKRYDAIVVGAGLSGLHAARILEEQGLNVLVLEGRNRIGGRVYTLMDVPGRPEAAGEFMGPNYARMIDTARTLGVDLVGPESAAPPLGLHYNIKGQTFTREEWPDHPLNPLSGDDRTLTPDRLLFVLSHRNNPLSDQPLDYWLTEEMAQFDIPQSEYLKNHLGFNDETIRLMNTIVHTDHMDNTSALHELRRYAVNEFNMKMGQSNPDIPAWLQAKGGNYKIPEAMAASLNNPVLLNKTVYGFEDDGGEVTVNCMDGSVYKAKQVICSLPYPVMRHIKFAPRLPKMMERAVSEIDYGISIQVHFNIKEKFWEKDGLPPSMWTDTVFERFYVLNRGDGGAPSSAIAFINGDEAFKYNLMTDQQVIDFTLREIIKARPAVEGALEPITVQSCHRDVHGAGDWVFWQPGQVTEFASNMREPHGNIHFAGEHTAIMERGMEGAFESGERAAFDALFNF